MAASQSSSLSEQQSRHVQIASQAQETLVPYDEPEPSSGPSNAGLVAQRRDERVARIKQLGREMPAQDVCVDDDFCSECGVVTPQGGSGHVFWDDIELLRHGWCDKQGHHWNKVSMPRDEAEMLHDGLVDRACQHHDYRQDSPALVFAPPPTPSDTQQQVHFAELHSSQYIPFDLSLTEATVDSEQLSAETRITRADMPDSSNEVVAVEGGGTLTKMGIGQEHRVYHLALGSRRIFLERGTEAYLVLNTDNNANSRLASV